MIQLKIFDPIKIEKKKNKLNEGKKKVREGWKILTKISFFSTFLIKYLVKIKKNNWCSI